MRVIIDGDSCPCIDIITSLVIKYKLDAYLYCDYTHHVSNEYIKVINVDKGYQSVDMKILSVLKDHDLLITNDYGLASLGLTHDIKVMSYKGTIYTKDNTLDLLNMNYLNRKQRIVDKHIKGPKKRSKEDDKLFINSFISLIQSDILL